MAINYAEKYSTKVDERFKLGALTNGIVNNDFDWIGVETVKVYSIPTVTMGDYTLTGASRYGTPAELQNAVQEMKVAKDRSFTFTIDRKSYDDGMMVMEAGKALARQIDEVIIPEIDTYRIAKLVAKAGAHINDASLSKTTAYTDFLALQEKLDEAKVPTVGRVALVTPAYYNLLKQDDAFIKRGDLAQNMLINGQVGEVDGVAIVKVPSSYFPENVFVVITNAIAMPSPIKLAEYKIHDNAPGISGWLVEGRVRYDAFVLDKKANAVVYGTKSAS